jgi:hypothetical protein
LCDLVWCGNERPAVVEVEGKRYFLNACFQRESFRQNIVLGPFTSVSLRYRSTFLSTSSLQRHHRIRFSLCSVILNRLVFINYQPRTRYIVNNNVIHPQFTKLHFILSYSEAGFPSESSAEPHRRPAIVKILDLPCSPWSSRPLSL